MVVEKKISLSDDSSNKPNILSELENIIKSNKVPNALLFTGADNSFLKKSADNFAKSVNCLNPLEKSFFEIPCHTCRSCKKIMAEMHPDIVRISQDNQIIKISAIRNLFQLIISKPNEAKMRAVIIENAETMNEQAQNAFLKMLEEPPANTFFILIADNINSMLATIVSRCRNIWFRQIETNNIESDASSEKNDKDLTDRKRWLLNEITHMIVNNQKDRFIKLKPLLLAEKLSNEPDFLKDSMSIIRTFLRDITIIRYSPDKITNIEYLKILTSISKKTSLQKSIYFFKKLYEAEKKNRSNPSSIRLNLECLFLKISCGEN
ncbi:MAG: hypothetical protein KAJ62_13800 [Desulfobacteraceae bacterium]|nr:hypothetical protein [Desulfobacteraceae bacterium]